MDAECAKLPAKLQGIVARDELDPSPPYPFANGPLFVVSRELAVLLANDAFPTTWLRQLEQTPVLQFYQKKGRVPFVLRKDACFPSSFDAVLGWWVNRVVVTHKRKLTLVNSPFMIQHHPWVAFRHGAFSNSSIILHELKNPNSPGWAFAASHGAGPFVPFTRTCDTCEAMRWSTWPASHAAQWECCGLRHSEAELRKACRSREACAGF